MYSIWPPILLNICFKIFHNISLFKVPFKGIFTYIRPYIITSLLATMSNIEKREKFKRNADMKAMSVLLYSYILKCFCWVNLRTYQKAFKLAWRNIEIYFVLNFEITFSCKTEQKIKARCFKPSIFDIVEMIFVHLIS